MLLTADKTAVNSSIFSPVGFNSWFHIVAIEHFPDKGREASSYVTVAQIVVQFDLAETAMIRRSILLIAEAQLVCVRRRRRRREVGEEEEGWDVIC